VRTGRAITDRELEVVAAWWHEGTVVGAAEFLGLHEQTAKNLLHTARLRAGATTTLALARLYAKELPAPSVLRKRVKARAQRRAA
jgi:hypothetical protein